MRLRAPLLVMSVDRHGLSYLLMASRHCLLTMEAWARPSDGSHWRVVRRSCEALKTLMEVTGRDSTSVSVVALLILVRDNKETPEDRQRNDGIGHGPVSPIVTCGIMRGQGISCPCLPSLPPYNNKNNHHMEQAEASMSMPYPPNVEMDGSIDIGGASACSRWWLWLLL